MSVSACSAFNLHHSRPKPPSTRRCFRRSCKVFSKKPLPPNECSTVIRKGCEAPSCLALSSGLEDLPILTISGRHEFDMTYRESATVSGPSSPDTCSDSAGRFLSCLPGLAASYSFLQLLQYACPLWKESKVFSSWLWNTSSRWALSRYQTAGRSRPRRGWQTNRICLQTPFIIPKHFFWLQRA